MLLVGAGLEDADPADTDRVEADSVDVGLLDVVVLPAEAARERVAEGLRVVVGTNPPPDGFLVDCRRGLAAAAAGAGAFFAMGAIGDEGDFRLFTLRVLESG